MGGYESVGRLFGRKYTRKLSLGLDSAGINLEAEIFLGLLVIVALALSLALTMLMLANGFVMKYVVTILSKVAPEVFYLGPSSPSYYPLVVGFTYFIGLLVSVVGTIFFAYVVILLRIDSRRNAIEQVLPDFLLLAAANIRAGMSIDQALWYGAKPEFGLLASEIEMVARRSFAGEPIEKSLTRLTRRFDSRVLSRAVSLIKQGMASGGEVAKILERIAEDARSMQLMKKEISASLMMYVIFILFAAAIATPFLFSVAHQLLIKLEVVLTQVPDMSSDMTTKYGASAQFGFIQIGELPITSDDFLLFSLVTMTFTVFMSTAIVGIIRHGSKKEGLKLFPIMLVVSFVVFVVVEAALSTVLKMLQ